MSARSFTQNEETKIFTTKNSSSKNEYQKRKTDNWVEAGIEPACSGSEARVLSMSIPKKNGSQLYVPAQRFSAISPIAGSLSSRFSYYEHITTEELKPITLRYK